MKWDFTAYLSKHAFTNRLIPETPNKNLGVVVVIPAHDEEELISTLSSLQDCNKAQLAVEVIVVFNASENADPRILETNQKTKKEVEAWYKIIEEPRFKLYCLEQNALPQKHAGVGLARKIGMDEAVRRFQQVKNESGVIVCFDADAQCEANYLEEIENYFKTHPNSGACSIHFEHPIKGDDYTSEIYEGIYYYELHLRYYKNGLRFANLPYAFHTIGSSMAVNVLAYCKQGGMNRRKAGEDFYFLQKFIDIGTLTELNSTKVIPSPRASHRVPFGTGRAIQEMIDQEREIEKSYSFECFRVIKECFSEIETWYVKNPEFHSMLVAFLGTEELNSRLSEIRRQSTSKERFVKRFFQWFNAFQTLKFIHFLRDHYFVNQYLTTEVELLLNELGLRDCKGDLLGILREIDRSN